MFPQVNLRLTSVLLNKLGFAAARHHISRSESELATNGEEQDDNCGQDELGETGINRVGPRESQVETQEQQMLQMMDDAYTRLIIALERLEIKLGEMVPVTSAGIDERDKHEDMKRDENDAILLQEEVEEIEMEVLVQNGSVHRIAHHSPDTAAWLVGDFLSWIGGRSDLPPSRVDHFTVPILIGMMSPEKTLKELRELWEERAKRTVEEMTPELSPDLRREEFMDMWEKLEVAKVQVSKMVEEFEQNPDKKVTLTYHKRGSEDEGLRRLGRYEEPQLVIEILERFYPETILAPKGDGDWEVRRRTSPPKSKIPTKRKRSNPRLKPKEKIDTYDLLGQDGEHNDV